VREYIVGAAAWWNIAEQDMCVSDFDAQDNRKLGGIYVQQCCHLTTG